jgi:hypothetical protein
VNPQAAANTNALKDRLRGILSSLGTYTRDQVFPVLLDAAKQIFVAEIGKIPGESEFKIIVDLISGLLDERGSTTGGTTTGGGTSGTGPTQLILQGPFTLTLPNATVHISQAPAGRTAEAGDNLPGATSPPPAPQPTGDGGPTPPPLSPTGARVLPAPDPPSPSRPR